MLVGLFPLVHCVFLCTIRSVLCILKDTIYTILFIMNDLELAFLMLQVVSVTYF